MGNSRDLRHYCEIQVLRNLAALVNRGENMYTLYQSILAFHAFVGLAGLVLFWFPALLKKGSPKHKQIGKWFINAMLFTGATGLVMAMMLFVDPIAARFPDNDFNPAQLQARTVAMRDSANFLFLLGLLLLTSARHASLVLQAKQNRSLLRRPLHLVLPFALLFAGIYLAVMAATRSSILFGVFAGLAIFISTSNLWYAFKPQIKRFEWILEHLGGAFGGGIAAHTAFFVFGANRFIGELFSGQWQLVPWVGPSVIGAIAITLTTIHYRKKYGHYKSSVIVNEPTAL